MALKLLCVRAPAALASMISEYFHSFSRASKSPPFCVQSSASPLQPSSSAAAASSSCDPRARGEGR